MMRNVLVMAIIAIFIAVAAGKKSCKMEAAGGCVKVSGSSGWVEFCPLTGEDSADADGADSSCVSFRPFGWDEVDASGKSVHSINNLKPSAAASTENKTYARFCDNSNLVCANTTDDKALNYTSITLTAKLGTGNSNAQLVIDVQIIHADGKIKFGDTTKDVKKGSYKFNVLVSNYAFQSKGTKASFDIIVKNKKKKSDTVTATNSSIDGGAIENFPMFAYLSSQSQTKPTWKNVDVTAKTKGANKVVSYTFEGPFISAFYDPYVPPVSDSSAAAATASAAVAVCAMLLALMF